VPPLFIISLPDEVEFIVFAEPVEDEPALPVLPLKDLI
jgi:hypothetical protein